MCLLRAEELTIWDRRNRNIGRKLFFVPLIVFAGRAIEEKGLLLDTLFVKNRVRGMLLGYRMVTENGYETVVKGIVKRDDLLRHQELPTIKVDLERHLKPHSQMRKDIRSKND